MKTKNVVFAGLTALSMTLSPVATCVAQLVTPVYAAEATQTYATPNGVADFGKGNASITITPNAGQSLVGKKFQVYKLFDAENAVNQSTIHGTMITKQLYRLLLVRKSTNLLLQLLNMM